MKKSHASGYFLGILLCIIGMFQSANAEAPSDSARNAPHIYSYRNKEGRSVFVDSLDKIPARYRKQAKPFSVSHVSLNENLGNELEEAAKKLKSAHEKLSASAPCVTAKKASNESVWQLAWNSHRSLVVTGAGILLLLLSAPWFFSVVGSAWSRALFIAIPSFALLGGFSHVLSRTNKMRDELRNTAKLCTPSAWNEKDKAQYDKQVGIVSKLQAIIARGQARRDAAIEAQTGFKAPEAEIH